MAEGLMEFRSSRELREWVAANHEFIKAKVPEGSNCRVFAYEFQKYANDIDGYYMSEFGVTYTYYNQFFKQLQLDRLTAHTINSTVIRGKRYIIDPQTGEVIKYG